MLYNYLNIQFKSLNSRSICQAYSNVHQVLCQEAGAQTRGRHGLCFLRACFLVNVTSRNRCYKYAFVFKRERSIRKNFIFPEEVSKSKSTWNNLFEVLLKKKNKKNLKEKRNSYGLGLMACETQGGHISTQQSDWKSIPNSSCYRTPPHPDVPGGGCLPRPFLLQPSHVHGAKKCC